MENIKSYDELKSYYIRTNVDEINAVISPAGLELRASYNHIKDRMDDRNIEAADLGECLRIFSHNYLMTFVYYAMLDESIRPYRIYFKYGEVILQISRSDDYSWFISTVLHSSKHNLKETGDTNFKKYITMENKNV